MSTFKLRVISAEGRFFDGECESLVFPTLDGMTGILADHCNMLGAVSQGIAEFTTPDGTRHCAAVDEGFVKVEDNDVLLRSPKPTAPAARRSASRKKSFCAAAYASIRKLRPPSRRPSTPSAASTRSNGYSNISTPKRWNHECDSSVFHACLCIAVML